MVRSYQKQESQEYAHWEVWMIDNLYRQHVHTEGLDWSSSLFCLWSELNNMQSVISWPHLHETITYSSWKYLLHLILTPFESSRTIGFIDTSCLEQSCRRPCTFWRFFSLNRNQVIMPWGPQKIEFVDRMVDTPVWRCKLIEEDRQLPLLLRMFLKMGLTWQMTRKSYLLMPETLQTL